MEFNKNELQEEIGKLTGENKAHAVGRSMGSLSEDVAAKVVEEIKRKKNIEKTSIALALITGLAQNGGSNVGAGTSVQYALGSHTLTSGELKFILNDIQKGATIRQLCRTLRDTLAEIAIMLKEHGDLSQQMRLEDPSMTETEACWCSSFQTGNPNCPEKIRRWLTNNYNSRFKS